MSEEIYLYPEELSVEPKYNSRMWPPTQEDIDLETEAIAQLSKSIASQGQLTSCVAVVDPARPLPYVLIIGHRRRRAIAELNAAVDKRADQSQSASGPLRKLRIRVDRTGKDPLQQAVISNLYEKSYSPMDIASAIHYYRKEFRKRGCVGGYKVEAQRIALYLDLQPSTVVQYEKLLTGSDEDTRKALHSGLITVQSAHEIIRGSASKRRDVIDLATKIESDALALGRKPRNPKGRRAATLESKRMFMHISRPSVMRAMEELGAGVKPISKSRAEIAKLLYALDSRDYGFYNGDARIWARSLMEWVQGVEPTSKLLDKFKVLIKNSNPGSYGDMDLKYAKRKDKITRLPSVRGEQAEKAFELNQRDKIYKGVIEL